MIELFYEDMNKTKTSTKEIMELLDGLFPFGANLNWYDTSCNDIENLSIFQTFKRGSKELKVHNLITTYTEVVKRSLDVLNRALYRIPSLAFGKKTRKPKRHSKTKRKKTK